METREAIKSQFDDLGFDLVDAVLDKCVELCVLHNIDEESFVETWMAFSITNLNGEAPTVETLLQMERKELANQDNSSNSKSASTTPLTVYNKTPTSIRKPDKWNGQDVTPKTSKNEGLAKKLNMSAPRSAFSPASFSPIIDSPSGKYSSRTNAGQVVSSFSERPEVSVQWTAKASTPLTVAHYSDQLTAGCRLMMEPLKKKVAVHCDVISRISSFLVENNQLPTPVQYNTFVSDKEVVFVGRVCSSSKARLHPTTVLLEGCPEVGGVKIVSLSLHKLPHFALFPGQVVAVCGTNPTGDNIIANKIFTAAPLPLHPQLPRFSSNMQIVMAAGPFTQTDSLDYEPLQDLMSYVKQHRPHLVILAGPVVDLRQSQFSSANLAESYQQLFDKIINGIAEQLKGSWTQVVVLSSCHDGTCLPLFPTPPPLHRPAPPLPNLRLVSDPCLLNINGLIISVTSTDSLMHLSKEEISAGPSAMDRLGRLASHLIHQQSIYPLSPPSEELPTDTQLWDNFACFPVTPHILITPSNLRFFIKQIEGCVVVNPEHLTKGSSGGTFLRMEVEPPTDDVWSPSTHISAQILKI